MKPALSVLAASLILAAQASAWAKPIPQLGKDSIESVIAAMTDEEKIQLVMGTGMNVPGLPEEKQAPVVGAVEGKVPGAAGSTFAILRLGIPSIVLADGPAGLRIQPQRPNDTRNYWATAFPVGTLLASSWNTDTVRQVGQAIGQEAKAYGVDILLAPALNAQRNPLGGRNFEYYSEDPVVSGQMAAAYINGVQSQGVGTAMKHFALNDHETNRNVINVKVNEQTMREMYLRGFEIAMRKSHPWTVMSSYNRINGTYASESADLLTGILRQEWGFNGLVMSDWFGGSNAVAQLQAGNDLLMPGNKGQKKALQTALKDGKLSSKDLDINVSRILRLIERTPTFQHYAYDNRADLARHAKLARQAATEGMVLLKNNAALPLAAGAKHVALLGNASYDTLKGGFGSGDVHVEKTVSLAEGLSQAGWQPDGRLKQRYEQHIKEQNAQRRPGNPMLPPAPLSELDVRAGDAQAIEQLARTNDVAILTLGRYSGEFIDRRMADDYELSTVEKQLLHEVSQAFRAQGKKVVVVLNAGGAMETRSWRDDADAILLAWLPGQEAGAAIADIMSGKVNPSGKLAVSFPEHYQDLPSSANFPGKVLIPKDPNDHNPIGGDQAAEIEYNDGQRVGYRALQTSSPHTAFPFGHGLSYTTFNYSEPRVSLSASGHLDIRINVRNTGKTAGKESVQVYISQPANAADKALRSFAKTRLLKAGEQETLRMQLEPMDWAAYDAKQARWVLPAGRYQVAFGASSQDIRAKADFEQASQKTVQQVASRLPAHPAIAESGK